MMTSPHTTTNTLGAAKPARKNGTHSSSTYRRTSPSAARPDQPKDLAGIIIKCPRCDSPNTKFCYYNNYSLTQPRHFCKTCRRYWTKGGALRSVPIGGGCRKNKKLIKSSSSSSSSKDNSGISSSHDHDRVGGGDGLKFFKGLSPAMDFQLDYAINTPRPNTGFFNQISSFCCLSAISSNPNPGFPVDPTSGLDFPLSSSSRREDGGAPLSGFQEMGSMDNPAVNYSSNLASSIESLSFINQDLHWKLQQQRLGMLFGGDKNYYDNQKQKNSSTPLSAATTDEPIIQNHLLQANANTAESYAVIGTPSRKEDGANGDLSTELFFDNNNNNNINNSYATLVGPTPETSNNNNNSNWSGFQAWTELTRYASLP